MTDRRQHRRFILTPPLAGQLQVYLDVRLEGMGEQITLLTRAPGLTREPVVLRLLTSGGRLQSFALRPGDSTPVTVDGTLWQRVRCDRLHPPDESAARPGTIPSVAEVSTCVVVRTVPAQLLQFSGSGCLLEIPVTLGGVRFARLDVTSPGGEQYSTMLRVCRPGWRSPGAGSCRVAAEFVPAYEDTSLPIQQFVTQYESPSAF